MLVYMEVEEWWWWCLVESQVSSVRPACVLHPLRNWQRVFVVVAWFGVDGVFKI